MLQWLLVYLAPDLLSFFICLVPCLFLSLLSYRCSLSKNLLLAEVPKAVPFVEASRFIRLNRPKILGPAVLPVLSVLWPSLFAFALCPNLFFATNVM